MSLRLATKVARWMSGEIARALLMAAKGTFFPVRHLPEPEAPWWKKPGLGIMYQIEHRPGWEWDRDYEEFNRSMMDDRGNLRFNGPFCRIAEWVELSKEVGVDYHVFEAKWHDGIC